MRAMNFKTPIPQLYDQSLSLLTDLYQLTMAYGYWKLGLDKRESVFHLIFRRSPFKGGFTIAAGLESLIGYVEQFKFNDGDLSYLATLKASDKSPLFSQEFLTYLSRLKFTCDIDAIPEGTTVFPQEPLIRVQGPLIECQLLESPLLNLINFPTLIATKAARIRMAAKDDLVLEFGLRRAQGIDGVLTASRAAYIGGCDGTSNVMAGKLFGIPVSGTHSHSWIMVFDDEKEAFRSYAEVMPANCVFLVDTYNTIEGVKKAIEIAKQMRSKGNQCLGIRLDSGDLAYLSIISRQLLDEAGFSDVKIAASNELDEAVIMELKRQGARIDIWGVGTSLITAKDQPALDGVYKLSALKDAAGKWVYKLKLSEQMLKVSNPGIMQVRRYSSSPGSYAADMIYDVLNNVDHSSNLVDPLDPTREKIISSDFQYEDLLVPIFRKGNRVYDIPDIHTIRKNTSAGLEKFHVGIKRFLNPHQYVVGMEENLYKTKIDLIKSARKQ